MGFPKKNKWLLLAVGPITFFIVLTKIDIKNSLEVLLNVNIVYVVSTIIILYPLTVLLRTYKWDLILRANGINLLFKKTFTIYYIGLSTSLLLPGNLGTVSRPVILKKEGHPLGTSIMTTFYDKLSDVVSVIVISLISLLMVPSLFFEKTGVLVYNVIFSAIIMLLLGVLVFALKRHLFSLLKYMLKSVLRKANISVSSREYNALLGSFKSITIYNGLYIFLLSVIIKFLQYFRIYILALSLNIPITFFGILFCANIVAVISFLPISYNGIGVRDATFFGFFPCLWCLK